MAPTLRYISRIPLRHYNSRWPIPNTSQGVYIYRPTDSSKAHGERPSKRRKVLSTKQEPEQNARLFAPLLNGDESPESIDLRYRAFQHLWGAQEAKIQVSMLQYSIMVGIPG